MEEFTSLVFEGLKITLFKFSRDLNGRWTGDQAREAFERSIKQEQGFAHLFTGIYYKYQLLS